MKYWNYACDKCKKPIEGKRYRLWLYDPEDIEEQQDARYDFDLCESCAKKTMNFLCTPVKGETSAKDPAPVRTLTSDPGLTPIEATAVDQAKPDPGVKGKKKPGPEKKIDTGKALALWKAGWDYAKIANEMGLNEKQVKSAVYRARKEEKRA